MKKTLLFLLAFVALVSCSKKNIVESNEDQNSKSQAIVNQEFVDVYAVVLKNKYNDKLVSYQCTLDTLFNEKMKIETVKTLKFNNKTDWILNATTKQNFGISYTYFLNDSLEVLYSLRKVK